MEPIVELEENAKGITKTMMPTTKFAKTLTALGLVATFLFSTPAWAQPTDGHQRGDRQQRMQKRLDRMTTELNLSPDQAERIRQLMDARRSNFQNKRERMKSILSEEQLAALKEMRKNRKRGERGNFRERLAELGITEDQMSQLRAMRQEGKASRKALQADIEAVLDPDQLARFQELKAERKAKHKERRRQRRSQETGGPTNT